MIKKSKKIHPVKFPSELRMDMVGGDWVVVATGRARRPETFKQEKRVVEKISKKDCPFCNLSKQEKPTLIFNKGRKMANGPWTTVVVPNKYPAFLPYPELNERTEGKLHKKMNAVGFHEVVITFDHQRQLAQFSIEEIKEVFDVYQQRYLDLMDKKFVNHISIFHNHGREAGSSISHPHSQIITTPLIDIDLQAALDRSKNYYEKVGECIYCRLNKWEKKIKKRIVFENNGFLVVCPFASKTAFEVIISPKKHLTYFEKIKEEEKWNLAEAFQKALSKLYKGLNNPNYNFYLHTAPCVAEDNSYYHWHWTILPKTAIPAGFEIGTRMEISTIEPEKAAEYLRKQSR
ncbi:MAG: galactose-1-phosphate uridylyltransferase [Candidatus Nealsonbacteria bacterium CG10_big_fil_rev_8_21_14_0_10_36_24]|uniref:Galactose-1-phosphate uridylyltransferase n=3 Tax=Patescibacteria group TaxID=1783273 RepID=A0A2H0YNZ5_9BACT|nr:MAG: galactose-1-phosphate uridylyltransferase [Candidatus Nealsonbacteria bacterium CG10_big_fil_rev_8_21_14_0_10_36_24]PIS40215.1 MAG: galactose-1-phosphate uridylyltransferase [Candidatus Nealsonbacteria bacterium CG08_land_8_20_14_0_20_36_22]